MSTILVYFDHFDRNLEQNDEKITERVGKFLNFKRLTIHRKIGLLLFIYFHKKLFSEIIFSFNFNYLLYALACISYELGSLNLEHYWIMFYVKDWKLGSLEKGFSTETRRWIEEKKTFGTSLEDVQVKLLKHGLFHIKKRSELSCFKGHELCLGRRTE